MSALNTRLFWIYSLFGGLLLLTVYLPLSCTALETDRVMTKEYAAYQAKRQEIRSWLSARSLNHNKIEFYEALAGKRPLGKVKNHKLRDAAGRLLEIERPITYERAEKFRISYCGHVQPRMDYYECKHKLNFFSSDWRILNDPQKVVWLMSGDPEAVSAVLPEVPEKYQQYPPEPEGITKYSSVHPVSGWIKWLVMSLIFTFGYFISRAGFKALDAHENPFSSSTEMALSRLVVAGFAPGFLFFAGLHLLTPDGKAMGFHLKRLLRLTSFENEHEALIARLMTMRERAAGLDNSDEVVRAVDSALKKVRSAKNFEALSKIHADAGDIDRLYAAKKEVEELLS